MTLHQTHCSDVTYENNVHRSNHITTKIITEHNKSNYLLKPVKMLHYNDITSKETHCSDVIASLLGEGPVIGTLQVTQGLTHVFPVYTADLDHQASSVSSPIELIVSALFLRTSFYVMAIMQLVHIAWNGCI